MTTDTPTPTDETRRFLTGAVATSTLAAAFSADADIAEPIRAYGPVGDDLTFAERSVRIFDEVEAACGGGLPPVVLIGAPTGSGWVNPAALAAVEGWTRGHCASVALQFGTARSQASSGALGAAIDSVEAIVDEYRRRVASRPETQLVVWAESFGAWALLGALARRPDLLDVASGVHVIWVGVPGPALADPVLRATLDHQLEHALVVRSGDELDRRAARQPRGDVLLIHDDDPIPHLPGISLVWRPQRHTVPTMLPRATRIYRRGWLPLVTALHARRTLDLVTRPAPSDRLRDRHDYRYAAAAAIRACLDLPLDDQPRVEQLVADHVATRAGGAA